MKNIFFCLFLMSSNYITGQNFGDNNATWVYDHFGSNIGVTIVEAKKDTFINGETLQIFEKSAIRQVEDSIIRFDLAPVYISNNEGVVKYSQDLIYFDTLYNFNAKIGSIYRTPHRNSFGDTTFVLERELIDTFRTELNGVDVLSQVISYGDLNNLDTFYQNIGSRYLYILPFDNIALAADEGEGGILRCYQDDLIGIFDFRPDAEANGIPFSDFEYDCDQLSSIQTNPTSNNIFNIYPNPVSNILHIRSTYKSINQIDIYNLNGQQVYQELGDDDMKNIDITSLSSGIYYILINEKYFEKLVVVE